MVATIEPWYIKIDADYDHLKVTSYQPSLSDRNTTIVIGPDKADIMFNICQASSIFSLTR